MDAPQDLDGRVALVTDGADGIGRAVTDRLLAAGAQVAVTTRHQPDELPAGARWFGADTRVAAEADDLVAAVIDHYGRLDVLVSNPGGSPTGDAATADDAFVTAVVTLNLLVPLWVSRAANAAMQAQDDGGAIVTFGPLDGLGASPGAAAYGAAKAGLVHLTQSLAVEWAPKVRVNCVSTDHLAPGPADLPDGGAGAVPLGRLGTGADLAEAVAHLASPAAGYVTGSNLLVHGGDYRPAYLGAIAAS